MTKRHVRFTATVRRHVTLEKIWWMEHPDYADVFEEELEQAIDVIATLPGAGTVYAGSPVPGVRRLYLRRIDLHLHYTFNRNGVIVRALWGARRGHAPEFKR